MQAQSSVHVELWCLPELVTAVLVQSSFTTVDLAVTEALVVGRPLSECEISTSFGKY